MCGVCRREGMAVGTEPLFFFCFPCITYRCASRTNIPVPNAWLAAMKNGFAEKKRPRTGATRKTFLEMPGLSISCRLCPRTSASIAAAAGGGGGGGVASIPFSMPRVPVCLPPRVILFLGVRCDALPPRSSDRHRVSTCPSRRKLDGPGRPFVCCMPPPPPLTLAVLYLPRNPDSMLYLPALRWRRTPRLGRRRPQL